MKKIAAVLFVVGMALGACGGKSKDSKMAGESTAGSGSDTAAPMGGAGYGGATYGAPAGNPCGGGM